MRKVLILQDKSNTIEQRKHWEDLSATTLTIAALLILPVTKWSGTYLIKIDIEVL